MTATRSRLKRLAEVAPDDAPEALERGDPQPADVPVPVDMEDLAAQPAPAEGPQLPAGVAVVWNASEGRHMRVLALDMASIELVELGVLTRAKAELLPLVREQVSGHWASAGVDIADEEVDSIALSALQLGAVDVAEVYSPHRFSARAAEFQLRPGFAADLEELKEDGTPWDLRRPEDVKELERQQERMDPILLTGSPPCEKFSLLRGLSAKFRTDEQEAAEMEEARHHLKVAVDAYWRQLRKPGRYFLHEHPWSARSWKEDIVKELVAHPGVFTVKGPMCRWGMKLTNPRSGREEFVRKETGWVTNHPGLARRLQGTCSNVDGRAEWHRHIMLVGGIARFAKVYPPKLVEAVLEELKDTLDDVGELSTAQVQQSGPVPVDAAVPPGDWTSYWDDVNGGYLEAGLVAQARAVERERVKKQELIEIVPRSQAFAETGRPPIPLKWVDTNKGDAERPNYRSRLVVKEIKAKKRPDEQLEASEVFSAMPPLEAMRSLVSLMVTWTREAPLHIQESLRKKGRAHFYGKAQRRIFVELEEESRKEYGEDKCGLLLKSWYGTQDASKIWQGDYTELLEEHGYKAGVSCPAVFFKEVDETRLLGHGDDFAVLAQQQDIDSFEATLGKKYEFKKTANLGFDEGDDKQAVFLNRVIEVSAGVPPGGGRPCRHAMIEPDKRRAEIVIDELGLSKANGVDTPMEKRSADKQMMDAKSAALGAAEASRFRSLTMRVAYLSQDRLDLAEASKTLARSMQTPTEASWLMLKRVGRYLKRHPSTVTVFTEQKMFDKIRVHVDSDHAGCAVTRKSTGGFVAMLGHHVVKHGSNLQSTVSLSSGESEYYALVKGGSVGLGLHSLFADWGLDLKVELASDSSAARGHVQRRGLGKMRHVQSRYLWIQERVGKGDLSIAAVPGKNNVADVLTKSVGGSLLRRHMATLNIWDRTPSLTQKDFKSRAEAARQPSSPNPVAAQISDASERPVVRLHIYDVTSESAVQRVNDVLRPVGVGIFHVGVEEWSYGYSADETGVGSCAPRRHKQHRYRESLEMGASPLSSEEIGKLLERMEEEWHGKDYDLLSRNCCHFSDALCRGLGVGTIPEWLLRMASAADTVRTGVDNAALAAQTAARLAAERAGRLDDRYQISCSIDQLTTREVAIDERSVGASMEAMWSTAAERASWVGSVAERWFDEAQRPASFDPEAVERFAAGFWSWASSAAAPAPPGGPAERCPVPPAPRSELARCREVTPGEQSPLSPEAASLEPEAAPRSSRPALPPLGAPRAAAVAPPPDSWGGEGAGPCLTPRAAPLWPSLGLQGLAPPACGGGSPAARSGAKKQAEFAASALDFDDLATARKCLRFALRSLEAPDAIILEPEPEVPEASSGPPPERVRREARLCAERAAASLGGGDAAEASSRLREALDLLAEA
ncbi:unnamed protein product [Prorocentrum cordatum]|uniref:PPPDE domain-containing protein n=1 Tax=Prorocentrum cordatum TaxID=2364126 RepID=A0ABN9UWL9_9DINO|nr:unnamed protein product [Polarella glacialis]